MVDVVLDTSGQHTLSWSAPIALKGEQALPPGSCNMYLFPAVILADGTALVPEGAQLAALKALVVGMTTDPSCNFAKTPDEVGAFPIHAVTVANTEEAINLSEMMFVANPKLLLPQVHAMHRAGFPLFTGESSLHICCVNRREKLLLKLIQLMMSELPREEALALLRSQAVGVFFNEMPMLEYGGTPLSYALCFSLKDAVVALLDTGLVSLNERAGACEISGFLPVHTVTANGLNEMYDWMTIELPPDRRAIIDNRSGIGRKRLGTHGLTPVQLAAKLGDHAMTKHILRKQTKILWIWGPVTQHSIDLRGIDSAGEGGGDIMELVARIDASRATTELVLDDFCQGFLNMLFLEKWNRFAYKIYYARMVVDLIILVLLIVVAFALKDDPGNVDSMKPLCLVMLVLMALMLEEECRVAYLYKLNYQGEGDARVPEREMLGQILTFCKLHWVRVLILSYAFTAASCIIILAVPLEPQPIIALNTTSSVGRMLKSGGNVIAGDASIGVQVLGSLGNGESMAYVGDEENASGVLWLTLFGAIFLMMPYIAFKLFTPFEKLNIFMLSVVQMLQRDLVVFLLLFGFFMIDFYVALFVLYPRSGVVYLPQLMPFNTWYNALRSLFELSFTGSPALIDLESDFTVLSTSQQVDFVLFLVVYLFFIILSIILLLNLLIAMLSFTFEAVRDESTLQCRTAFAQCLMRLELIADAFGMDVHVGEHKGEGKYVYEFRSVESLAATDTGGKEASQGDPFAPPDLPPLARIELKLGALEERLNAIAPPVEMPTK